MKELLDKLEALPSCDAEELQYMRKPGRVVFLSELRSIINEAKEEAQVNAIDAELFRYFLETCSEEVALYISGNGQASADELKSAIAAAMNGLNKT